MANGATGLFDRIDFSSDADSNAGLVRWSATKSIWWSSMCFAWLTFGSIYFSWFAVVVFLGFTAATLCLGHSLGMHRKLIHESFESPLWVERVLVYFGTLVGLGGPFTMLHTHDMRDWAQRQSACHPFLSHQNPILKDFWWQLHCKLHLDHPPSYHIPKRIADDTFYRFLERTWMLQQLPWALMFYVAGGVGVVAWAICGRVTLSVFGHWIVGYFAHNQGQRDWHVKNAAVQGYNVKHCGVITFGECWHNNHHAFPGSAKLGLYPGQTDPGWWILVGLQRLGLASNLNLPETLPPRAELVSLSKSEEHRAP